MMTDGRSSASCGCRARRWRATEPAAHGAGEDVAGRGPGDGRRDREGHVRVRDLSERGAEDRRAHPRAGATSASTTGCASIASCPASSSRWAIRTTRDMTKKDDVGQAAAAARRSASPSFRRCASTCAVPWRWRTPAMPARPTASSTSRCADTPRSTASYTVFGKVITGMDVVRKIAVGRPHHQSNREGGKVATFLRASG